MSVFCIHQSPAVVSGRIECQSDAVVMKSDSLPESFCRECVFRNAKSRGLGDTVAKTAKAIGLRQRKNCGCQKRQQDWNAKVAYR